MKLPIGSAIAGATAMAVRSLGSVQVLLAARPPSPASPAARGTTRGREATLLKIEINFNR